MPARLPEAALRACPQWALVGLTPVGGFEGQCGSTWGAHALTCSLLPPMPPSLATVWRLGIYLGARLRRGVLWLSAGHSGLIDRVAALPQLQAEVRLFVLCLRYMLYRREVHQRCPA